MKKTTKRTWWIIAAVVVVIALVVGIPLINARKAAASTGQLQTAPIARGTLTATIGATGTVRANQTAMLAWQTSGMVAEVNVQTGFPVQAGDVLASLAQSSLSQNIILAQSDLVTARRNLDAVTNSTTTQAQAQLAVINAQRAYDSARNNLASLETRGHASQETIDNAWAQYVIARQAADQAQTNYDRLAERPADDPMRAQAYTALYAAIQRRDQAYTNWNYYNAQPSTRDIDEATAKLALAEAQLQDANREWARLQNGPDPNDIAAAQARVSAIQATLNNARLAAPFSGTITEASPMLGDQISPGTFGFRLDDLSHLLVDVQVSEVDINSVQVGQPAAITFDAVLGQEYHGQVTQVAQAGDVVQGAVNFTVTVELTDADTRIKPGMTAAVTITINELQNVLLIPNRSVRVVDGQRVVYLLRNNQVVEVPVTLGATSDTMSELSSGDLQEGELVILNPTTDMTQMMNSRPRMFGGGN